MVDNTKISQLFIEVRCEFVKTEVIERLFRNIYLKVNIILLDYIFLNTTCTKSSSKVFLQFKLFQRQI